MCGGSGHIKRGAERTIDQVADSMRERGHVVDIYGEGNLISLKKDNPFERSWTAFLTKTKLIYICRYLFLPIDEFGIVSLLFFIHIIKSRKKYDLLWIHTGFFGCFFASIYRAIYKVPYVVTCHCGTKAEFDNVLFKPNGIVAQEPYAYKMLRRQIA